jgi:hypothetical protein
MCVVLTPVFAAFILPSRIAWLTRIAVLTAMAGWLTLSGLSTGFDEALNFAAALM